MKVDKKVGERVLLGKCERVKRERESGEKKEKKKRRKKVNVAAGAV